METSLIPAALSSPSALVQPVPLYFLTRIWPLDDPVVSTHARYKEPLNTAIVGLNPDLPGSIFNPFRPFPSTLVQPVPLYFLTLI